MPYAMQADIANLYGQDALVVADHDRDGVPDAVPIATALDYATAEIDSYLRVCYTLPLPEVPLMLTQICVDIAVYQLASRELMTDQIEKRYERAIARLRDLSSGKASLVFSKPSDKVAGEGDFTKPQPILSSGPPRAFTRDLMRDI